MAKRKLTKIIVDIFVDVRYVFAPALIGWWTPLESNDFIVGVYIYAHENCVENKRCKTIYLQATRSRRSRTRWRAPVWRTRCRRRAAWASCSRAAVTCPNTAKPRTTSSGEAALITSSSATGKTSAGIVKIIFSEYINWLLVFNSYKMKDQRTEHSPW